MLPEAFEHIINDILDFLSKHPVRDFVFIVMSDEGEPYIWQTSKDEIFTQTLLEIGIEELHSYKVDVIPDQHIP
jgi:hypothetical protein